MRIEHCAPPIYRPGPRPGRGEMGRASGQRQLCHAHTHRPERYLETFRTESHTSTLTYLLLLITTHAHTHGPERYLGTFPTPTHTSLLIYGSSLRLSGDLLATLVLGCLCSIVFSYPCSETLMNLNLPQCLTKVQAQNIMIN